MSNGKVIIKGKEADRIVERALQAGWVLRLRRHKWGNRKRLAKELMEEKFEGDAETIRAVQRLLDCPELSSVYQCISYISGQVNKQSQPWFGEGWYWFNEERVSAMEEELIKTSVEMDKRLGEFLEVYNNRKEEHQKKHPKLYKEENYPSSSLLKEKFSLEWSWQRIRPAIGGEDVGVVGKEIVDREVAKFRDTIKGGIEVVISAARNGVMEVLEHLANCLKDGDKKFQDSTVEKPKQYLEELGKTLAFLDDKGLDKLIADSKAILNGVFAEDLRDDGEYRKAMANVMGTVVGAFKALPVIELERDIEL